MKINKLSFNTTFNLKYTIKNKLTPYTGLGPRLDYLLSYDENLSLLNQFEKPNDLNEFIFGLSGVFGIYYNMNKILLGIEFDYNYNITQLVNQSLMTPVETKNEINYTYQSILLSIEYKLK